MNRRAALLLLLVAALAVASRLATASPDKSAAKLDVTYYYLPG